MYDSICMQLWKKHSYSLENSSVLPRGWSSWGIDYKKICTRKLLGCSDMVLYLDYGGYLTMYLSKFIDLIVTRVNFYVYKNYILINLTFNKKAILISFSLCGPATLENRMFKTFMKKVFQFFLPVVTEGHIPWKWERALTCTCVTGDFVPLLNMVT